MIEMLKNVFYKVRIFFANLFEKDVVIKIGSLVAAIVIWFVISVTDTPVIDIVLYKVPVTVSTEGTYAEASGYQAMSVSEESVTVYIRGERGNIGNLKSEDLVAVASADNVMYAMGYNLDLEIDCLTGKEFEVTKIEPAAVFVDFDRIITKEVSVKPRISGIKASDGYIMGNEEDIVIVPDTVNITGPAEIVDSITEAAAVIDENGTLTGTTDFKTGALSFYNENTAIIDEEGRLSVDKPEFTVHVPVYERHTIALDFKITNAPESFDADSFKQLLDMSVTELEVAVLSENFVDRDSLDIGTIDMREADIGTEFSFETSGFLPEGYEDLNNVGFVTVTVPSTGLVRQSIHITKSSIQLVNAPAQYDFNIITSGVTPIFIGPEESMEQLTYFDVFAQVDMISISSEEGERSWKLPITFQTPSYNDIWCIGSDGAPSPRVTIEAKLKTES
ncbi:MAG: hypothetical protein NC253_13475 [Ruminococcus sp.]|nr:hypothetical protein [Ruminococcus sp.]MCM1382864.1 hypothetical protein [Muribaculaceae bacterium]